MILKLKYPVFLLLLSFLFGACEKEYSLEGNTAGAAGTFTFSGAPGPCASAVVTGTYTAGVALDANNTVTVSVDVTIPGSYIVLTSTTNGISFSGSGSFTSTGVQTITLAGTGIPAAAGTFSFSPGANGCTFPVIVSASAPAAVFTYEGGTGACTLAEPTGNYAVNSPLSGSDQVSIDVNVTTIGTWSVSTPVVNGFSFSGTGNFTATGLQKLILTAAGTPLAAGVFNFTPGNGCSFPITVLTGSLLTDSLVCKIDGVATTFNVDLFGEKLSVDTFNISGNQFANAGSPIFGITLTKKPELTTGSYDRYLVTNTSTFCLAGYEDGVSVTPWFTGGLPGSDGFTVIVTSYTSNRIEGTFSGTLFSDPLTGTGPKVITDGKFSVGY